MDISGLSNLTDMQGMLEKLNDNLDYPASKEQIMQTMDVVPQIPDQAKELAKNKLPDKEYGSIDDIKNALGL